MFSESEQTTHKITSLEEQIQAERRKARCSIVCAKAAIPLFLVAVCLIFGYREVLNSLKGKELPQPTSCRVVSRTIEEHGGTQFIPKVMVVLDSESTGQWATRFRDTSHSEADEEEAAEWLTKFPLNTPTTCYVYSDRSIKMDQTDPGYNPSKLVMCVIILAGAFTCLGAVCFMKIRTDGDIEELEHQLHDMKHAQSVETTEGLLSTGWFG
mmetsp:Transcript_51904/g.93331  ORF Transcript_51904/g.93331 Transcript_51904/m.93331 type:complete len:211 (+) Transcript_51904:21-653(+)